MPDRVYIAGASSRGQMARQALNDVVLGLRQWSLWTMLGWLDIRQRYRRSMIGPFWITISMGAMVLGLGAVYGALFKQDLTNFLPYVAGGFIAWYYISACISDGSTAFVQFEGMIKLGGSPLTIHILRIIWRNLITLAHNLAVMVPVYIFIKGAPISSVALLPIGLFLVTINLFCIAFILSGICTRFRDLPPIVANVMQLMFFVTPIVFKSEALENYRLLIDVNPFYYMIEAIRSPLIGHGLSLNVCLVLTAMAVVVATIAFALFARTRARIAFWI
jgi:ABC-type polysaccharide/polyol phosphate export permease